MDQSNALDVARPHIPAMSQEAVDKVRRLEGIARRFKQLPVEIQDLLHAGMYARTAIVPAGALVTGAQLNQGTILVVVGDGSIYVGAEEPLRVTGVTVLPASAGRKSAFLAETDLTIIAIAACSAETVAEAEALLTDETDLLLRGVK